MSTSTTIITKCSNCGKIFEQRPEMLKRVYGPAQVKCGQCGHLINTDYEPWKAKPLGERMVMIAVYIVVSMLPIAVYFAGKLLVQAVGDFGSTCFAIFFWLTILVGLLAFALLMQTLIDFIGSDRTPTW